MAQREPAEKNPRGKELSGRPEKEMEEGRKQSPAQAGGVGTREGKGSESGGKVPDTESEG